MKISRNIFKEIQDPEVLRYLSIGFACFIVTVFLAFFVASPGFRYSVLHPHLGIGGNKPVTKEHKSSPHKGYIISGSKKNGGGSDSGRPSNGSSPGQKGNGTKSPSSQGGGDYPTPNPQNPGGKGGNSPSPSPGSSPSPQPDNPGKGNPPANPGKPENPGNGNGGAKVEAEVNVPGISVPPLVEETGKAVGDTVNGVTKEIQAPVEVCVVKCNE